MDGLGKSRLFYEFKATAQSGCLVLETFSLSHGKASAYLPITELLNKYFEIEAEDDARKRREKITGRVLTLDRMLEDALPYLFALLGVEETFDALAQMDAQARARRTLESIKRILLRERLNQPLLLVFEDLHWIDDQTQIQLARFRSRMCAKAWLTTTSGIYSRRAESMAGFTLVTIGQTVIAAVISSGVIATVIGLLFQRRMTIFQSSRAWKEKSVSQLLGPLWMQLDRTKRAFDRWQSKNLYLEAKIIREGNLVIRDLLLSKADLIPPKLRGDAGRLVEHYDRWLEEYERVRGAVQPDLEASFVFAGPKGSPFPTTAEANFKNSFVSLWNELYAD